jgi:hypothetical protein
MSDHTQAGARPATSHRLAASALLAAASPIAHTANWRTCSTRVAPHALAAPLGRPACRRLPPFSDQALIPIVGNAQEHAFHELPPRLARSDAHTRRRPEVEDEQWIPATDATEPVAPVSWFLSIHITTGKGTTWSTGAI